MECGVIQMPKTCILICTCDRPELLGQLLSALVPQARAHGCVTIIVDNGMRSSETVVATFQPEMEIVYERLAEPGLVSARNRAMGLALAFHPEFLAFIDDDEIPEADWLANLIRRVEETGAGFACGPVVPAYQASPPSWVVKGEFFEKSGTAACTSNLLLRASCIPVDASRWFLPDFNFTGGEDKEFLNRLMENGAVKVLAETAIVWESVPAPRMKRRYIWRRGLRDGVVIAQITSLESKSRAGFAAGIICRAAQKLGYGLNHLFWTVKSPWRFNNAMSDMAAVAGIMLRAAGVKFAFYGHPKMRQGHDNGARHDT